MRWHASSSSLVLRRLQHVCLCISVCLPPFPLLVVSGACKSIFDAGDRPRCWPSAWRTQECPACTGLELCILQCSSFAVLFHGVWFAFPVRSFRAQNLLCCGAFSTWFDEVMDVVSYNTLIKAYVRHNLFDTACGLLPTMRLAPSSSKLCSSLLQ